MSELDDLESFVIYPRPISIKQSAAQRKATSQGKHEAFFVIRKRASVAGGKKSALRASNKRKGLLTGGY